MFKEELAVIKEDVVVIQGKILALEASYDSGVQAAYDKGFAEGVASVQAGDKIFTQAEYDEGVKKAVEEALAADAIADKEKVAQASEILNQI